MVLTNAETGEEIVATATPEGPTGHWAAAVTLPTDGEWSYQVRHDLEITLMGAQPIVVGDAQMAAGTTATAASPALLAAGGFLAVLGIAVVAGVLVVVHRSRPEGARA